MRSIFLNEIKIPILGICIRSDSLQTYFFLTVTVYFQLNPMSPMGDKIWPSLSGINLNPFKTHPYFLTFPKYVFRSQWNNKIINNKTLFLPLVKMTKGDKINWGGKFCSQCGTQGMKGVGAIGLIYGLNPKPILIFLYKKLNFLVLDFESSI